MNNDNNPIGTIGFIFACLGVAFCWLPFLGGLFWLIGMVLSCIGIGYSSNAYAWCGFWISISWIIFYIILGLIFGTFTYFTLYPLYTW